MRLRGEENDGGWWRDMALERAWMGVGRAI